MRDQALRRERDQLEEQLAGARVDLAEHAGAREAADRERSVAATLLGTLCRELRPSLAAIRAFSERAARIVADPADRALIEIVGGQSFRLLRVADDVLLAARLAGVEGGSDPAVAVPLDIGFLVSDAVADLIRFGQVPNHQLAVTIGHEVPRVRADAAEVRQAVFALVENATRTAPPGAEIGVAAIGHGDRVEIAVCDGSGDSSLCATRFDLNPSLDSAADLGLFLVRTVAARADGEVHIDEAPRGVTVTMSLPAIAEEIILTHGARYRTMRT